jgi:anionic cell wall polymer biosynthesis LytR-Cps2A-Psr (LCP) family protein
MSKTRHESIMISDPRLNIKLSKGQQHLNGLDACVMCAYRGGPTADYRAYRTPAEICECLAKEMLKLVLILTPQASA